MFLVSGQPAGSADSVLSCQRPLRVRGRFAGTVGNRTRSFRCRLLLAAIDGGWAGPWHSAHTALFYQQHCWGCASSHRIGNKEIRLPLEMIPSTGRVARRHCRGKDCRANLFEDLTSATRCFMPPMRSQLRAYQTGLARLLIMPRNALSRVSAAGSFRSNRVEWQSSPRPSVRSKPDGRGHVSDRSLPESAQRAVPSVVVDKVVGFTAFGLDLACC